MRKEKLDTKVKADTCLWNHILFWISDYLSFEEVQSPLVMPTDEEALLFSCPPPTFLQKRHSFLEA
jgi:hypothetical protein